MPPVPPRGGSSLLVGRTRERGILQAHLAAALAGQGGLVVLSGEAGIGKTALAEVICREARRAGACVLTGHCYDRSETPPYGPWLELLEQFRTLPDRERGPEPITEPNLTHSPSREVLFGEVRRFFLALAQVQPLVIVLDDLHWADTASLDLLRFVARQLESVPLLLLVTYRRDEVGREHPLYRLLPALVREALAVRIDVSTIGDADVGTLIEHLYQLPPPDTQRLTAYLQARAEGNPFFLGELLRSLEGTALLPSASGGWELSGLADLRVPVLLRQVIDARLERLGEDADALLAVAAVIGQVVPLALWATVAETTDEVLLPLVERAVDAHIIAAMEDGLTVRFAHALIREALYESVLPPRRRAWHLRIAEALLAAGNAPDPDLVAHHLSQAGDGRAVEWLIRAGERARGALAWRTATVRFEAALALLDGDDRALNERGWLRFRLAMLRRFTDPGAEVGTLEEAERLGRLTDDRALVACARFYQGMLRCISGDFRQGIAAEEAGIALLDALSPADRARVATFDTTSDPFDAQNGRGDLALAFGESGRFAQSRALGEQIIALPVEQTGGSRGDAYLGLGHAYAAFGQPEEAGQAFTHAREIFRAADHRTMITAALLDEWLVVVRPYRADQPHERQRVETELRESFIALDEVFNQRSVRSAGVVAHVLDGAWTQALDLFEQDRRQHARLVVQALLAPIARELRAEGLAWSMVQQGLPAGLDTPPEDTAGYTLPLRTLAVTLALDAGDLELARLWLANLERWLEWSGSVLGRADAHLCWAAYARALGDPAQARERALLALAAAEAPRQPLALLAAQRLLGELALAEERLDEAGSRLASASALADTCGVPTEIAQTLLARAELHLAHGDSSAARADLERARELCAPLGATLTLARVDRVETRIPTIQSTPRAVLPAGLTPREGEVLRLLAVGLSNAEIAEDLSLSPRTINAHLTSIYGKLGVVSRGAAIRFALDHELG